MSGLQGAQGAWGAFVTGVGGRLLARQCLLGQGLGLFGEGVGGQCSGGQGGY